MDEQVLRMLAERMEHVERRVEKLCCAVGRFDEHITDETFELPSSSSTDHQLMRLIRVVDRTEDRLGEFERGVVLHKNVSRAFSFGFDRVITPHQQQCQFVRPGFQDAVNEITAHLGSITGCDKILFSRRFRGASMDFWMMSVLMDRAQTISEACNTFGDAFARAGMRMGGAHIPSDSRFESPSENLVEFVVWLKNVSIQDKLF
jgi:hypothetical protein